ncbi:hypothetical protein SRHO_G00321830 [Serrasalmus rhombeus]
MSYPNSIIQETQSCDLEEEPYLYPSAATVRPAIHIIQTVGLITFGPSLRTPVQCDSLLLHSNMKRSNSSLQTVILYRGKPHQ